MLRLILLQAVRIVTVVAVTGFVVERARIEDRRRERRLRRYLIAQLEEIGPQQVGLARGVRVGRLVRRRKISAEQARLQTRLQFVRSVRAVDGMHEHVAEF